MIVAIKPCWWLDDVKFVLCIKIMKQRGFIAKSSVVKVAIFIVYNSLIWWKRWLTKELIKDKMLSLWCLKNFIRTYDL